MKNLLYKTSLALFAVAALVFIASCSNINSSVGNNVKQLTEKMGKETIEQFYHSNNASTLQIEFSKNEGFSFKEGSVISKEKFIKLKKLILDDNSYIFDRTKSCLFIPSAGWKFEGSDNLQVIYSSYCKQIKLIAGDANFILDVDPANEAFKELSE